METHPPKLVEAIIERLVPAACRENVLGDWNERYTSAPAYVLQALAALPFLVESQIRRTFKLERIVSEAVLVYIAYAAGFIVRPTSLYQQVVLIPLLIVIATVLLVLILRDAYADPEDQTPARTIRDIGIAVAAALCVEAILSAFHLSRWMLPWWCVFTGSAASTPLMFMVRRLLRPSPSEYWTATPAGSMSLKDLRQRAVNEHRQAWRLNLVWLIAGLAVICTSPNIQRPSAGLLSGMLLIAILIHGFWRHKAGLSRVSQEYTALSISRDPHRNELERKRDGLQVWAGGGLFSSHGTGATVVFFLIGLSLFPFFIRWAVRMPFPVNVNWTNVWLTIIASIGLSAFWVFVRLKSLRAARAIQDELDALDKEGRKQ